MHAVEAAAAIVIVPQLLKEHRRRDAVALDALPHLFFGLGIVRKDRRFEFFGKRAEVAKLLNGRGILRVRAELIADERVEGVVFMILLLEQLRLSAAAAEDGAKAHVRARLRDRLAEEIHVEAGGDAAREIFKDRKPRERVDVLGREPGLQREDAVKEPLLQRHIVREGAHKRHARVGVGVFEAREEQIAVEVDLAVKPGLVRARGADIGDFVAIHPDLIRRDGGALCHRADAAVIKTKHTLSPYFCVFFIIRHFFIIWQSVWSKSVAVFRIRVIIRTRQPPVRRKRYAES